MLEVARPAYAPPVALARALVSATATSRTIREVVMDKPVETNTASFVQRRLSQVKLLNRLLEHELGAARGAKELTLERELVENVVDALEIFVEDFERHSGHAGEKPARSANEAKPAVTRLN
jgi:hypothetical protein